jgi:OmpA-OmpF porin, OOP family
MLEVNLWRNTMKKVSWLVMMLLFGLLSANLYAAEEDAAGCKDHPLIPRMQNYFILGCNEDLATFDADIVNGKITETVHIEGKSMALLYKPQPAKSHPSEPQLRRDFENAIQKQGGKLVGASSGQKAPVYKIVKNSKNIWVVLMLFSGEYYTGFYTVRIVEP